MAKLLEEPFRDQDAWLMAIGAFIWRMGQLEYLTYEWCLRLGGETLRDAAISKIGFSGRYQLVVDAIASSAWPDQRKNEALKLWRKAKCFAVFRNKIAHAPVLRVRGVSVMLDARELRGIGKRPVTVYRHEFLDAVSEHIQRLAQTLDQHLQQG
jgi:hypothetical protein